MKTKNVKRLFGLLLLWMVTAAHGQTLLDNQFNDVSEFENYTVEDVNGDSQTWHYDDLFYAASCGRYFEADDWLFTPALSVVEGKTYRLTVTVSLEQEGSEVLAVMMGQSAQSTAMTATLVEQTTITSTAQQQLSATFKAASTGQFFIGFHYATPDDGFSNSIYLNRIVVEETADEGVPAGVTDLQVVPAQGGALQATVSFQAPAVSITGGALSSLTKIEVSRDGLLVKTFSAPAVGSRLSFDDSGLTNGMHTYRVVAFNDKGEGDAVEAQAYIGLDQIGAIENVRFVYDYSTHKSTITWDAPTKGLHGGYVDTSNITYSVSRLFGTSPLQTGLTATTFEDEVDIDYLQTVSSSKVVDGQGLMQYFVQGFNAVGEGTATASNDVVIGEPNQLPYHESFANGKSEHFWRVIIGKRARWIVWNDSRESQDGDGGYMLINAQGDDPDGDTSLCYTGNISMADVDSPVLSFYLANWYATDYPVLVKVSRNDGEFETIATLPMNDNTYTNGFHLVSIPLTGCAGVDRVKVGFQATVANNLDGIQIDNISIINQHENDLKLEITNVPRYLKVGESRNMTVKVENLGTTDVGLGQYTVNAYVGDILAGTTTGMAVKAGQSQNLLIPLKATIDMEKQSEVYAELVYAQDEVTVNNSTEPVSIGVKYLIYPEATQLTVASQDGHAVLSWQQPVVTRTEDGQVTDSFEDYADFERWQIGDWTLYDLDNKLTFTPGEKWKFPGTGDPQAYMVWNPSEVVNAETNQKGLTDQSWYPRTGDKMLISFCAAYDDCNDWLVSPELSGSQQVISFYAYTLNREYAADKFQVYYSSTGLESTNFMALDNTPVTAKSSWDLYEYLLPPGAKYFAIRKVTNDGWAFFVDDITFCPDTLAAQTGAMFFGYNVYKNGTRLNTALVSTPTFTDAEARNGDTYRVTAVYDKGESAYSNEVVYGDGQTTGITNNEGLTTKDDSVYDLQGRRIANSASSFIHHPSSRKGVVITNKRKVIIR